MNASTKLLASLLSLSVLSLSVVAMTGCSGHQAVTPEASKTTTSKQSDGTSNSPAKASNSAEENPSAAANSKTVEEIVTGRATWYGPGLYGNKTASGEILRENTLTAAHSQLPLGTKVKVTREDTNESVIVVINDRKPFKEGTVIDLAHGAADKLDIDDDGHAVVSLEVLD